MKLFGLIGYPLSHSFSKTYFAAKFEKENIHDCKYENFPIDSIDKFPELIKENRNICGLNVTIPYKEQIIKFLDELDEPVKNIGAVNTIKFINKNNNILLKGYNTDVYGFENSLRPLLTENHKNALILGTGGASKAIKYVLKKLNIGFISASIEELKENEIRYEDITPELIKNTMLIINATPLGTFPNIDTYPKIPYEYIDKHHLLFDLVYNPEISMFLKKGLDRGAVIKNGLEMLHLQAEKAWEIWNT
jgi:shikimate dehydrogenase